MYFGFSAPALRFEVYLFPVPFSSMITFFSLSPSHSCTHGGFCENWPCCTVIGEDVKPFKKILKLFLLFCVFEVLVILRLLFCFPQPCEKCCDRFQGYALPILLCRVFAALPFVEGILRDHLLII